MTSSAMILECPSCQARFEIGAGVNVVGRKVRCSRCAHVWQVQQAETELAEAPQPHADAVSPDPSPPAPGAMAAPGPVQQPRIPRQPVHPTGEQSAAVHAATGAPRPPQTGPMQSHMAPAPVGAPQTAPRMEPSQPAPVRQDPAPMPHPQQPVAANQAANPAAPGPLPAAVPTSDDREPIPAASTPDPEPGTPSQRPPVVATRAVATQQSSAGAAAQEQVAETVAPAEPVQIASPENETVADDMAAKPDTRAETSTDTERAVGAEAVNETADQDRAESATEVAPDDQTQDDTAVDDADPDRITTAEPSPDESSSTPEASDDDAIERRAETPAQPQTPALAVRSDVPDNTSEKSPEIGPKTEPLPADPIANQHDQEPKDGLLAEKPVTTAISTGRDETPDRQAIAPSEVKSSVGIGERVEPTFAAPTLQQVDPTEPRSNNSLEAALGDMFATPLDQVERRVPLGAPDAPLNTQGPVESTAELSPARDVADAGTPQAGDRADKELIPAQAQAGYSPYGGERPSYPATSDPTFSSPDEIAPDPSLERSHIDLRTDAPFATDFTQEIPQPIPSERRGRHVHADLHRRRAAINLGWFCLAAIVGSIIGIVTLGRDSVVRALPGAANFYAAVGAPVNTRGLDFADVSYDWTTEQGRPAIAVTGKIRNVSDVPLDVPTVVFVLLDDRGDELYNWASRVREDPIAAGGEAAFTAQVPAPPGAARRLRVRFARKSR